MRVYKEARKRIRDNGASFYFCRFKNFAINYLYIIQVFFYIYKNNNTGYIYLWVNCTSGRLLQL